MCINIKKPPSPEENPVKGYIIVWIVCKFFLKRLYSDINSSISLCLKRVGCCMTNNLTNYNTIIYKHNKPKSLNIEIEYSSNTGGCLNKLPLASSLEFRYCYGFPFSEVVFQGNTIRMAGKAS